MYPDGALSRSHAGSYTRACAKAKAKAKASASSSSSATTTLCGQNWLEARTRDRQGRRGESNV